MSKDYIGHHQLVSDKLHRRVYQAVVGLTLWFIASAWLLFSGGADADSFLLVLTAFFLIAMAIPLAIWMVWSKQGPGAGCEPGPSLRHWLAGDFDTCQYRLRGAEAAIHFLLAQTVPSDHRPASVRGFVVQRTTLSIEPNAH